MYCTEIREFIVEKFLFGDGQMLTNNTSFQEKGIMDSLGILDLVLFLESTYGVKIEDEEVVPENMDSVNKIVMFMEHKLNGHRRMKSLNEL